MGPRSHERGNSSSRWLRHGRTRLQWGRVLMNAETEVGRATWGDWRALQWGRVLMNAETAAIGRILREAGVLQWGRVLMNAETEWVR